MGLSFVPLAILVVVLLLGIFLNVPVAFALLFSAMVIGGIFMSPTVFFSAVTTSLEKMDSFLLLAIPLFIYMGVQLRYSGEANVLYGSIYRLAGGFRGSLSVATILTGTLIAAMSGISGAGTVALGLMALPIMQQYGYDKRLAVGSVSVAGALGSLIPPSVVMIVYGATAGVSIVKLYAGGLVPGLILAALSITYVVIISRLRPQRAPAFAMKVTGREKAKHAANILPALAVILGVMGAIYSGLATPTEAAVLGAAGAVILAVCRRTMSFRILNQSLEDTFKITCMVMLLLVGGGLFSIVFSGLGGMEVTRRLFTGLGTEGYWLPVIISQIILLALGCFLDIGSIIVITVPIFVPVLTALGVNPLWYGILFTINMELAYLTPPFGMNLFYMRAITPSTTTMVDIYTSMVPFLGCQFLTLVLIMVVPQLAIWLPSFL